MPLSSVSLMAPCCNKVQRLRVWCERFSSQQELQLQLDFTESALSDTHRDLQNFTRDKLRSNFDGRGEGFRTSILHLAKVGLVRV